MKYRHFGNGHHRRGCAAIQPSSEEDRVEVGAQLVEGGAHVGTPKAQPEVVRVGVVVARTGQQQNACVIDV
jgi:hypothetical protein